MRPIAFGLFVTLTSLAASAGAEPSALAIRTLGTPAVELMTPKRKVFALVSLPATVDARSLGLLPVVPGLAVIHGDAARVAGFQAAHPEVAVDLRPPLRPKLDVARTFVGLPATAGGGGALDGAGTIVGIVDTGVDLAHRDFRNADGTTRIAWFLDYAGAKRAGNVLDERYGGRVWERSEIDAILAGTVTGPIPGDSDGHGSHVAGIAAGNGGAAKTYVGIAPKADLIVVRASDASGGVDEGAAVLGTKFVFDRAAESKQPASVNLSLGTQYGAHDGTSKFERGLVELAKGPGRAVVVAASNEGGLPIHTSIRVTPNGTFRIPIELTGKDGHGAYTNGQVFVWINKRDRGDIKVGLRAPDGGVWLEPVEKGKAFEARPAANLRTLIANDLPNFLDEGDTSGAIAVISGALPIGRFSLELVGDGAVEIWLQGAGDAIDGPGMPLFPQGGQVEGSIGVPASAAGLISVGCVGSRTSFVNMKGKTVAIDDAVIGGRCYFSSAGPAANGAFRPDLLAPGYYVISTLAHAAYVASPLGNFDTAQLIDTEHGALAGTSMSSPFVAGAAALLFQRDPTLTQEDVRALLQAGARPLVDDPPGGGSPRDHAKGAGILDVAGAVAALDRRDAPPAATSLTMRLGATWLAADGGLPLYALVTAHDAAGRPADVPGGLVLATDNALVRDALSHPAVGVYRFSVVAAPKKGLEHATLALRGALNLERKVPIGADRWDARDGLRAGGGCAVGAWSERDRSAAGALGRMLGLLGVLGLITSRRRRSRARSRAAATAAPTVATAGSDRRR